jgi:hypothetical protein
MVAVSAPLPDGLAAGAAAEPDALVPAVVARAVAEPDAPVPGAEVLGDGAAELGDGAVGAEVADEQPVKATAAVQTETVSATVRREVAIMSLKTPQARCGYPL